MAQAQSETILPLPPTGKPYSQVTDPVVMVSDLIYEANQLRALFEPQWLKNRNYYKGCQWERQAPQGRTQRTINLISRSIDDTVAVMTQTRPRIKVTPDEPAENGVYFVKQAAGQQVAAQLQQSQAGITGVFNPNSPDASPLLQLTPLLDAQAKAMMDAGLLKADDVWKLDDEVVAQNAWKVVDRLWDLKYWDWKLAEVILDAQIIGHRDVLIEFDEDAQEVNLVSIPEQNTWIDPLATDIDEARYFISAEVMSADAAIDMYPQFKKEILNNLQQTFTTAAYGGATLSPIYNDQTYRRDMCLIYTAWIRDQEIPLKGEDGEPALDDDGEPRTKTGIRQIKVVAGAALLEDGECPYPDIPVVRFKNVPLPDRPYTLGEPEKLYDLQMEVNRTFSNMGDHGRYMAGPQQVMPNEARKYLKSPEKLYSQPNRLIFLPAEIIKMIGGASSMFWTPPPIAESVFKFFAQTLSMFHEKSGQSDVMRGQDTPDAKSGVAIEALQSAARGSIGFKSFWAEKAVRMMAKAALHCMVHMAKPGTWQEYIRTVPPTVLDLMQQRAQKMEFKINVEMAVAKGQSRNAEANKALTLFEAEALSLETLHEKMEIADPSQERARMMQDALDKAKVQMQIQAMMMAQQAQQQQAMGAQQPQQNSGPQKGPSPSSGAPPSGGGIQQQGVPAGVPNG